MEEQQPHPVGGGQIGWSAVAGWLISLLLQYFPFGNALQLQPAVAAEHGESTDHVAVDIELQPPAVNVAGDAESQESARSHAPEAVVIRSHPTGSEGAERCHVVVNVADEVHQVAGGGSSASAGSSSAVPDGGSKGDDGGDGTTTSCCVVCTEPLEWVAVGRCGHRVVCAACMVRSRFFHRNKRCCICRARCPKVVVTRCDGTSHGAAAGLMSALPLFAFREGRVGKYWYHRHTAAYFEDEQHYIEARAACHGILSPFYKPLVWFIYWFGSCLLIGATMGYGFASQAKHRSSQVTIFSLSVFIGLFIGTIIWSLMKSCQDPAELERRRKLDK